MFFRNLIFFRFPASMNFEALEAGLAECALRPVGGLEMSTRGFISPYGADSEGLFARQNNIYWLAVGGEHRDLPGSVVNDLLEQKLKEIEEKEGRRPGGRTRKRLKDELITDLLPRTFIKKTRTDVIIDVDRGIVAIDTSSKKTAESCVSEIRRALGSFPALPLNAEVAPRSVLTGWVAGEELPEGIAMGDECELRDALDQGAVVKCQRMELEKNPEIDKHLQSGKQATRLALMVDDHVSFVLGEDLVLHKFKLLDGAVDTLENTEREDMRAELDARFTLMAHETGRVFDVLERALKLSQVDDGPGRFTSDGAGGSLEKAAKQLTDNMRANGHDVRIEVSAA